MNKSSKNRCKLSHHFLSLIYISLQHLNQNNSPLAFPNLNNKIMNVKMIK